MRVGSSGEGNTFLNAEFDDSLCGIKFVYGLAPSGGGKLNRETARSNQIERLVNDGVDLCGRPMTMDFDKIEMCKAVHEASRRYFADTAKIISVKCIDIFVLKLFGASRDVVEHLICAIEEMDRTQNKIELVPMSLDPLASNR